jgi:AcrR family transcriptional regulator
MSISKEEIVHNALILLDDDGLDGVTLRKLATKLKIKAPSLYWHFKSKQALLDEMASAIIDGVAQNNPPEESWQETIRRIANEMRSAFLAHRDGAKVYSGTYPFSDNVFRLSDAIMGKLCSAGIEAKIRYFFFFSVMYFIIGFVIEEQALKEKIQVDPINIPAELIKKYPLAKEVVAVFGGDDLNERFSFGIELLIHGLTAIRN